MSPGAVALGFGGLALAGVGIWVATRHEPTPRERLVDALISPVEAVSGATSTAISLAPYIPLLIILLLFGLLALIIFVIAPALPGIASGVAKGYSK